MRRPDYRGQKIETFVLRADSGGEWWSALVNDEVLPGMHAWTNEPAAWAGAQTEINRRLDRRPT